jgi:hypothetical protein
MKETFWAKPKTTIDKYTIKKHMDDNKGIKKVSIRQMSKREFETLEKSEWAKNIKDKRPKSNQVAKPVLIHSNKQVQDKIVE